MKVVKCTTTDIQSVGDFYDETVLYLSTHENFPKWMYKEYPSVATVKQAVAEGSQYMCVETDVVGAFVINTDPKGNYSVGNWTRELAEGDYLVIHSFATKQTLWRKGIATKMLNFIVSFARQKGFAAIRLDVVPTNYPARAFYEKHGFTFAGEKDLDRGYEHIPTFCLYELNF